MSWRDHFHQENAAFSANTNVHPAFGNLSKIARNRALTRSVMYYNFGIDKIGRGEKPIEATSDPLRRKPELIVQRSREEMSIAGRTRGMIRPAAPGQVKWKYPYWSAQRPPNMPVIGPFTQGSLEKQSILYRISTAFSKMGGG